MADLDQWPDRGEAIAHLAERGGATYLTIEASNHGRPVFGSVLSADAITLSSGPAGPWPSELRTFASDTARVLMLGATNMLSSYAGLMRTRRLHGGPFVVVRAQLEALAQVRWILGPGLNATVEAGDEFARQRAARAYLTRLLDLKQRRRVDELSHGVGSMEYAEADRRLEGGKVQATNLFTDVVLTSKKPWTIAGQARPDITTMVQEFVDLAFQAGPDDRVRNPYGFQSAIAHMNVSTVFLATEEAHGDDIVRRVPVVDPHAMEVLARFTIWSFARGAEIITAAMEWPRSDLDDWEDEAQACFDAYDKARPSSSEAVTPTDLDGSN